MNNALTISCVDSIAILFMFYLKIFLGCCNDKTSSALTQKQAALHQDFLRARLHWD